MRILAIIPAAEGLQSFPNRNLRVLCGKPLISYTLNTAKKATFIDDIIVTSNSDEVLEIVSQIGGAKCYRRPKSLSGTEITLERVINNVREIVDFNQYDYVVTMQSVSPTLKSETLDEAIELCMKKNIDTMISVLPKKNYLWKYEGDKPAVFQKIRVEKKRIEPFFIENGSFFISRPKYISDMTRIGGRVELFPLNRDEAISVMSFGDLAEAEYVLKKKKIAFYVNGNSEIGMGHIYRAMLLADEFFTKPTFFIDKSITKKNTMENFKYEVIFIEGTDELVDRLKKGKYNLLINDILGTTKEYMLKLRDNLKGIKIVNFEDDGEGAKEADLVINALYDTAESNNWRIGASYYIAPKLLLLQKPITIKKQVKNVLITFGGADPMNYTEKIISIIKQENYSKYTFHIVIGPANKNANKIKETEIPRNVKIYNNQSNLLALMIKCDVAVSSRGRTGFELAICGIPTVCISQNEREERHNFLSEKNGFIHLGYNPSDEKVNDELHRLCEATQHERKIMQRRMLKNNLKNGRKKVVDLINNM